MSKRVRDENTATQHLPRQVSKVTSTCEYCGKKFTTRGITRHKNACQEKKGHDKTEATHPFKFPFQSNSVFEYFLQFLSNQTLAKLQIATRDHYQSCEPHLVQFCCPCDEDNPVILHGLCRECEAKSDSYLPRTTKQVARTNYGVRDKDFRFLPCEVRKHYTLFDRQVLETHMIETCGSKLEWVRFLAKKVQRKKKLQATLQRKENEASDFLEGLASTTSNSFAQYMKAIDAKKMDKKALEQCSQRFDTLTAALEERGLNLRSDSHLCKELVRVGRGNVADIVDIMEEMKFLFTHTDYAQRCGRLIENCRDDAKRQIRREFLQSERGLTLPRVWENMRSPFHEDKIETTCWHFAIRQAMSTSEEMASNKPAPLSRAISDRFRDFDAIQKALRNMNLESSNLMFAIDYTTANLSFDGKSLHSLDPNQEILNPYQEVFTRLGRVLVEFDDDRSIQVSGFGDAETPEKSVFSFTPENPMDGCKSFNEIWRRYHDLTPTIELGEKPANLAPVLRHATAVAREVTGFHMLIILVSSHLAKEHLADAAQAIVDASMYPLSIIVIGVGGGPWDNMKVLDDQLPQRQFDNFNFVNFQKVRHTATEERKVIVNRIRDDNAEPAAAPCELDPLDLLFTLQVLMEVPVQYECMCKLNLL
ncbi:hypothetical protein PHMEG_00013286 [Phytophthora megakarya]|uniref:Copine C-terminal domain-containing protein n=1 Tax=Phytophthora megakarya TaxID=4795 RepID=A0A225W8R9_9STRA|nr:hypothetical protein PHMEG_00013286 [Phytophthora megakarya]